MDPKLTELRKSKTNENEKRCKEQPKHMTLMAKLEIKSTNNEILGLYFPFFKWMQGRMLENKPISFNILNGREFTFKLNRHLIEDACDFINFLCPQIASLNRKSLNNIAAFLNQKMSWSPCHFLYNSFKNSTKLLKFLETCRNYHFVPKIFEKCMFKQMLHLFWEYLLEMSV